MNNKVAIIGAGYTGLSCAKKLSENGYEVTIFEKTGEIGGIAKCIDYNNTKIEKHYRHIFKSDKYVIELLKDLNILEKLHWNETKMAYYSNKGLYGFGTPFTLLKYEPLSFIEKIRFGLGIVKLKLVKNYKNIEQFTAEEWMKKNCGAEIYHKIWEPLLISKFGSRKSEISMAWLWGKINLRSSSSTIEGERLGYLDGSFYVLTKKLEENLIKNNCKIKLDEEVISVRKDKNNYIINTSNNLEKSFDFVVSTVSYNTSKKIFKDLINSQEKEKMDNLEYTSAKTLIIFSKKSLTPYYWVNIGDNNIPFGGIIEHTNMINKDKYLGANIIYISNYLYNDDTLYKMSKQELFNYYYPFLKKINNKFRKDDVINLECFEELYAQPIITTNYSKKCLDENLQEKGIYMATMGQIYPEDRRNELCN